MKDLALYSVQGSAQDSSIFLYQVVSESKVGDQKGGQIVILFFTFHTRFQVNIYHLAALTL